MTVNDEIIDHEKMTRRSLAPFGVLVALLLIGFVVAMIYMYR
jgi:hypothetical protein